MSGSASRPRPALRLVVAAMVAATAMPALAAMPMPTTSGGAFRVTVTSWRDLPFKTVVRQQFDYSCGSAALATLLHFHYDRPVGEAEIFKAMYDAGDQDKIRRVGFSLLEMKQYLAKAGLQADGYRMSLADVAGLGQPGIVLITTGSYRHFVVVKGIARGRVLVGDPAAGQRTYTIPEFEKLWSNGIFFAIRDEGGRFNNADEWRRHVGPLKNLYLAEHNAAAMLRDLPPLYQITPVNVLQ